MPAQSWVGYYRLWPSTGSWPGLSAGLDLPRSEQLSAQLPLQVEPSLSGKVLTIFQDPALGPLPL